MERSIRILLAAFAMLAVCVPAALGDSPSESQDGVPIFEARAAKSVKETSATLVARISDNDPDDRNGESVTYRFNYGTSPAYGSNTGYQTRTIEGFQTVEVKVTGLVPGTTYHFRAEATDNEGTAFGPNVSFTTAGKAPSAGAPKGPEVGAAEPTLGKTVVVEVAEGTVLVREQGSAEFVPLQSVASVPVNSVLDTTAGTVVLETATGGGESQTGTFHGGQFQVSQSKDGKGMTTIALRGGDFSSCGKGAKGRLARGKALRKLWAKDRGGKFKTKGKGSVATVRGTSWFTADRCDGTLTKVSHGAVFVRERGTGRSKLVKRGQSFFAHLPR